MSRWMIAVIGVALMTGLGITLVLLRPKPTPKPNPVPMAWAYPFPSSRNLPTTFRELPVYTVPGSKQRFTQERWDAAFAPGGGILDWFPDEHPPMPTVVSHGRKPDVMACAYCHLSNGQAGYAMPNLSGLSRDYILEQLAAFRADRRKASLPTRFAAMNRIAKHLSPADAEAAAAYFARLPHLPWITVREAAAVPKFGPTFWGAYQPVPGSGTTALGDRIIELPMDEQRAELGDPHSGYIAYVPPGSLARGRAIAEHGHGGQPACTSCHGADLKGVGLAPPLAGRSPTYMARQLWDMHTGNRSGGNAVLMQPVARALDPQAIVAVSAYAAAVQP